MFTTFKGGVNEQLELWIEKWREMLVSVVSMLNFRGYIHIIYIDIIYSFSQFHMKISAEHVG